MIYILSHEQKDWPLWKIVGNVSQMNHNVYILNFFLNMLLNNKSTWIINLKRKAKGGINLKWNQLYHEEEYIELITLQNFWWFVIDPCLKMIVKCY